MSFCGSVTGLEKIEEVTKNVLCHSLTRKYLLRSCSKKHTWKIDKQFVGNDSPNCLSSKQSSKNNFECMCMCMCLCTHTHICTLV